MRIRMRGTIHLRRWRFFTIFDPYPPPSAVFYYYPSANLANFRPLPPKKCRRLKWMVPEGSKKNFCISSHVRCAQTIVKDRYSPPPAFARCCFLLQQENYEPLTTKKQTLKISVTCTCQHYYLCTNQGNIKENR